MNSEVLVRFDLSVDADLFISYIDLSFGQDIGI